MTTAQERYVAAMERLRQSERLLEIAGLQLLQAACAHALGRPLPPLIVGAPQKDTRAEWITLVAKHEGFGLSRVEAIKAAAKEQPALYDAQCTLKEAQPAESPTNPTRAAWEAAIEQKVTAGLSKVEAIKAVMVERPDLAKAL